MYPEQKGGSHKMARPQQNWGLLTLLTRWASIWTMPNTASPKSEPPCGRAVYTPVRATILGHPPQKTAPGGLKCSKHSYWPCESKPICIVSYCIAEPHINSCQFLLVSISSLYIRIDTLYIRTGIPRLSAATQYFAIQCATIALSYWIAHVRIGSSKFL